MPYGWSPHSDALLPRDEAVAYFKGLGEHYKAEIISSIPANEEVSLYREGAFEDLCRGPHVPSTGRLKYFKLMKVAGAYWRGDSRNEMLQRIYGTAWPLLDLVALGLIADVAHLREETRSLARLGIRALRSTSRLGLKVMAEFSGSTLETLTEETIGFAFAPRLNALGRLGDANPAVELLLSRDPVRARVLAAQLESLNAQRRLLTSQVYHAAEAQLEADPRLLDEPAIVLAHPDWPAGVIGIAASRLVERYRKPVLLLAGSEDGILRGSARSVEGLHITQAIATQKHLLGGFGGHPMAAGISMDPERLPEFRRGFSRAVQAQLGADATEEPALLIDAWVGLEEITTEVAASLESLAPFGAGNPALTFATRNLRVRSAAEVGRTREHLRLVLEDRTGRTQEMMWWGGAGEELAEPGTLIDIAYSLRASGYRGGRHPSAEFIGYRLVEAPAAVQISARQIAVIDLRGVREPAQRLAEIRKECPSVQVWAEGSERMLGKPRHELQPGEALVIYTSPPSAVELRRALEAVHPDIVYLFAVRGAGEKPEDLIPQLAGLCKYSINQRGGKATLQQLAAASGQRESAIRHGLEWLRLGGHLDFGGEDELDLRRGQSLPQPALQREFLGSLTGILKETAAYRRYYETTLEPAALISS